MISKKCNDCKLTLPNVEFYNNQTTKDGKSRICKACGKVRRKLYRAKNKEKIAEKNKKNCAIYYKKNRESMLLKMKNNRDANSIIRKIKSKNYYEKNSEKRKKYRKEYYTKNKEKELTRNKEYAKNNKGICNAVKVRYHVSKLEATPSWADLDKIRIVYQKSQWLSKLTGLKYHVDHVVPLQGIGVCGLHVWDNLQILEDTINCSKRNKY